MSLHARLEHVKRERRDPPNDPRRAARKQQARPRAVRERERLLHLCQERVVVRGRRAGYRREEAQRGFVLRGSRI